MKKLITVLVVLLFVALPIKAQFHLSLEPALGMNFNLHGGSDLPKSGTGFGMVVAGRANMDFSKSIGLIAGLDFYDNRSGSFTKTASQGGVNYSTDNSASLAYFQIESLFKYTLPSKLYFVFGPVLGFNIEGSGEAVTTITTPGYTFQGGSTTQTDNTTFQNMNVRFELKAGAGYPIPLAKKIELVPEITFGYGLTNVQKDVKWTIMTFQALVGVKFDLM